MNDKALKISVLIYTLLLLAAAGAVMTAVADTVLAIALGLAALATFFRPRPPGFDIINNLAVICLAPLSLAPWLARITALPAAAAPAMAAAAALPVYYHLDRNLVELARSAPVPAAMKEGTQITTVSAALLSAALALMLLAGVVGSPVLLISGVFLLVYLLGGLIWVWLAAARHPLAAITVAKRIIAGTEGSASLRLTSRAAAELRVCLRPAVAWLQAAPQEVIVRNGRSEANLSFRPPLAGQSRPRIQVTALDTRGLVRISQTLEPLQLHIIPRAEYAAWLATRYLEQAGSGVISEVKFPRLAARPQRGTEYRSSRSYQPGDTLRDIDWKHTLKLSQLIVREYQEAGGPAAIIAVNLSVTDDEEADTLAFNLITAALTLAKESIPAALAAYDRRGVVLSRGAGDPMEVLRQALLLVREIKIEKFSERYLEPVDIARVRRNISQLRQTDSEAAMKLLDIFNFEHRAIEESARNHPATLALTGTARQVPAPAVILLISQLNHDVEAVLVTSEKLARRKYTTLPVDIA